METSEQFVNILKEDYNLKPKNYVNSIPNDYETCSSHNQTIDSFQNFEKLQTEENNSRAKELLLEETKPSSFEIIDLMNENENEVLDELKIFFKNIEKKFEDMNKNNIFNIVKIPKENKKNDKPKKNRGRKCLGLKKRLKLHNKYEKYNIMGKVQPHYFTKFLIPISNAFIKKLTNSNEELKLIKIERKKSSKVSADFRNNLKKQKLFQIFSFYPQSKSFTTIEGENNKKLIEKVCKNSREMKNFFSMSFLDLFDVYMKKFGRSRIVDFKNYFSANNENEDEDANKYVLDLIQESENSNNKIEILNDLFSKDKLEPDFVKYYDKVMNVIKYDYLGKKRLGFRIIK